MPLEVALLSPDKDDVPTDRARVYGLRDGIVRSYLCLENLRIEGMNWRKVTISIVIAGVIIAAGAAGTRWWRSSDIALEAALTPTSTTKVTRGHITQTVDPTGRVVSNLDVEIKCRASGEIRRLPFDVSDHVKKGDLLLELDPVDQERLVQQSEAALAASKARLAQAEATLAVAEKNLEADKDKAAAALQAAEARAADASAKAKREEQLLEKKFSSPEGLETAQTTAVEAAQDVKTARAQIESLKAQELDLETKRQQINLSKAEVESDTIALSLAQLQLKYTSVYAPIDGVVSSRPVQIGQIISSGISNVGGGTTVMTLSDLSRIFVLASVDEADIGFVKLGQTADITADSYPGKHFKGVVDRIAAVGVNVQNVVTFEVRIEVLDDDKTLLKPEMTTNVHIIVADKTDVLMVPIGAILRAKGETFVTLANPDGTPGMEVPVTVGISDNRDIEIAEGLKAGDTVVVQSLAADSRWRNDDQSGRNDARAQRMMMRTMGGGVRR